MANLENNNDKKKSTEQLDAHPPKTPERKQNRRYRFFKIAFLSFLGLLVALWIILSLSSTRNWAAQLVVNILNKDLKTQISFDKIDLSIFGNITIYGLKVKDYKGLDFIKAKEVYADSDWFSLITNTDHLDFQSLKVSDMEMKVITYKGDSIANFNRFIALFDNGKKRDPNKPPFELDARISILNSQLSIVNQNRAGDEGRWLDAQRLNVQIPRLKVKGSDVSAQVNNFSLVTERWGKKHLIETFSTNFTLNKEYLWLENLVLNTDHSLLQGDLKLLLNEGKFEDFAHKVRWDMQLDRGSQMSGYDLSYFVKDWDNYKPINVSGKMDGVLNDFYLTQFHLGNHDTHIATQKIRVAKILEKSFAIETQNLATDFTYQGLKQMFPSFIANKMGNAADGFGRMKFNGALTANPNAITTKGTLISGVGQAAIKHLTLLEYSTPQPKYTGELSLSQLNVAAITKNNQVGLVSGHFNAKGEGFNLNTMHLNTQSQITSIEILDKTLTNVLLDGTLAQKQYNGLVSIKDPHAQANVKGRFDFSNPRLVADVLADVAHLDIAYFTGKAERQVVSGLFDVKMAMKDLNDLNLDAKMKSVQLISANQTVNLPEADVKAYLDGNNRIVDIDAPQAVKGKVSGHFNIKDVAGMVQNSMDKILAGTAPRQYYRGQYFKFDFDIAQGLVNFFEPRLKIRDGVKVSGNYDGNANNLVLSAGAPHLKYMITKEDAKAANEVLAQSDIDYQIETSSVANESVTVNQLALNINTASSTEQVVLSVDKLAFSDHIVRDLSLKGSNENGEILHLAASLKHGNPDDDEHNRLKEYAVNLSQTTDAQGDYVIRFEPTEVRFNNFVWRVDTSPELNHSITYKRKTGAIDLHNLKFYSDNSEILVNGIFNNGKDFDINAEVKNVEVSKLMALKGGGDTQMEMGGTINGMIDIKMNKSILEPLVDLKVEQLSMNRQAMGDIIINAQKTEKRNIFAMEARVLSPELLGADKLKLTGTINNNTASPTLDLLADMNEFDLAFAQEFVKSVFSNFRGKASGQLKIGGTIKDVDYQGDIALKDFGLKLNFSGVDYAFDDTVIPLTKGYAVLNNIGVKDGRGNSQGTISGAIQFADAASMGLNLIMRADNLLLLNTTQKDFDTFWGRVYGRGDIFVEGPVTALNIDANMDVLNNSTFTLNSNSASAVDEFKMLRFVGKGKDGLLTVAEKKKSGANMNIKFDISIDKGSTVNVLVGDDVGDISVRGMAEHLKFNLRRNGQMSMSGTFVVDNGTFVSKAILERTFQIAKGSSMGWDGNVMNPSLNISADYFRTVTNAGEYLNIGKLPPINVMLTTHITQSLQNPKIDFNVSAPDVSSQIKEALAFKMSNSDEKIVQFGAILALNNFNVADTGGVDFNVGNTLVSQGYNLLFKQLGSVLNTISNQFQVDLNYIKGDQASNTGDRANAGVNIALSPRVNIKTGLGVPLSKTEYTDANFLSGEGILEYDWSKKNDGSRLFRVYSKPSNVTNISGQAGANQTWGGGVVYSKSFNRFFPKKKKDSMRQPKDTTAVAR